MEPDKYLFMEKIMLKEGYDMTMMEDGQFKSPETRMAAYKLHLIWESKFPK